jgi:hypothetical protein
MMFLAYLRDPIADRILTAIAFTVGGTVFFVGVALVARFVQRRDEARLEAWRLFAATRGYRYTGAGGPWYRRTAPEIRGERGGVGFTLDRYIVSTGESAATYTRLQAECRRARGSHFTLRHNGFWVGIGRSVGMQFVETGDREFDQQYALRGEVIGRLDELLTPALREAIVSMERHITLTVQNELATLQWTGVETDAVVIDAAIDAIAALCRPEASRVGR